MNESELLKNLLVKVLFLEVKSEAYEKQILFLLERVSPEHKHQFEVDFRKSFAFQVKSKLVEIPALEAELLKRIKDGLNL